MVDESNMRAPGGLFGTVVTVPAKPSRQESVLGEEAGQREFIEHGVGQMRVTGANHSLGCTQADEFEIAGVRFFKEYIHERYRQAANIRSTENSALCTLFEELFRRAYNTVTLFLEDLENGRLEDEYDVGEEIRIIGLPGFEGIVSELSRVNSTNQPTHLAYLLQLRQELRIGVAEALNIVRKRLMTTTRLAEVTLSLVTITLISQLFELDKAYCRLTNQRYKPNDEGKFLNDATA